MSELKISALIMRESMLFSEEIYTTGKNFTLRRYGQISHLTP